jgi:peptidoglycan hydrolase-like protein with peptidoglycan-binding domain
MSFRFGSRPLFAIGIALFLGTSYAASGPFTSLHPEEAYPNEAPRLTSPGPYEDFIKQLQQRLHQSGFDAGPVNGDFGTKTQAALAQFQLARSLPASGQLDKRTLEELGVQEESQAAAGGSSELSAEAQK